MDWLTHPFIYLGLQPESAINGHNLEVRPEQIRPIVKHLALGNGDAASPERTRLPLFPDSASLTGRIVGFGPQNRSRPEQTARASFRISPFSAVHVLLEGLSRLSAGSGIYITVTGCSFASNRVCLHQASAALWYTRRPTVRQLKLQSELSNAFSAWRLALNL